MVDETNDFRDAANAIAAERYSGDYARGFAHLALQVAFPTFGFTDDQAEEIVTVDRRGDLGCDGIYIAAEEQQILIFQSKSSPSLSARLRGFPVDPLRDMLVKKVAALRAENQGPPYLIELMISA